MKQTDTKSYWENRLQQSYSISGVGFHGVGWRYNKWIYKARKKQFHYIIQHYLPNPNIACLDVGSGTGFYLNELTSLGFTQITGSDFTEIATDNLRKQFPWLTIWQFDVTTEQPLPNQQFDLIICMDMLFHIVEDHAYQKAISNLYALLKPGGYLLMSDNLTTVPQKRSHIVDRTRSWILNTLQANQFSLVKIFPTFIFLNPPMQTTHSLIWGISKLRVRLLSFFLKRNMEWMNEVIGCCTYYLDKLLLYCKVKDLGTSTILWRK